MKLATFRPKSDPFAAPRFGYVSNERIVPFACCEGNHHAEMLADLKTYAAFLPASYECALTAQASFLKNGSIEKTFAVEEVQLLPPVIAPPAVFDFALSPKHLEESIRTLVKYEFPFWLRFPAAFWLRQAVRRKARKKQMVYYKGNTQTLIGDGEETYWPIFSAYLDMEPELAFITGTGKYPIAGFTIFNDWTLRDIEMSELLALGPSRSKDFRRGNGLGPVLVTPDEIQDPLNLGVTVNVGNRIHWTGTTAHYLFHPQEVVEFLISFTTLQPGSVVAMGTVPGCCCLANDVWLEPGEHVEINFDKLDVLRQIVPATDLSHHQSRWKKSRLL